MKLITVKQLMKKSKTALIRRITKSLKTMPKKKLAVLCYQISKSKLPRLKTKPQKELSLHEQVLRQKPSPWLIQDFTKVKIAPGVYHWIKKTKRKTKRKFSKKQLAAQRLFAKRARAGTLRR